MNRFVLLFAAIAALGCGSFAAGANPLLEMQVKEGDRETTAWTATFEFAEEATADDVKALYRFVEALRHHSREGTPNARLIVSYGEVKWTKDGKTVRATASIAGLIVDGEGRAYATGYGVLPLRSLKIGGECGSRVVELELGENTTPSQLSHVIEVAMERVNTGLCKLDEVLDERGLGLVLDLKASGKGKLVFTQTKDDKG